MQNYADALTNAMHAENDAQISIDNLQEKYNAAYLGISESTADGAKAVQESTESMAGNVRKGFKEAADAASAFSGDVTTSVSNTFDTISRDAGGFVGTFASFVSDTLSNANEAVDNSSGSFVSKFVAMARSAVDGSSSVLSELPTSVSTTMSQTENTVKNSITNLSTWLGQQKLKSPSVETITMGAVLSGYNSIKRFASGGYPEQGEYFLARENGPELVGTVGNRTAVANNEQIVDAVARGVYEAVVDAMVQTGGQNNSNKAVNIYLDGRQIASTTTQYQRQFARAGRM